MHTLRDTATLAILVLLALTLRVELDGKPAEWNVGTTAEAAAEDAVVPVPAAALESQPAARPAATPVRPLPLPPGAVVGESRSFVWEIDGRRVIILVDTDEEVQADVEQDPSPDSCGRTVRAHLSS